jgi:hypothetical protein
MHAWLSWEVLVVSFATSGRFCPDAKLGRKRRKIPRIVDECCLLIAPPHFEQKTRNIPPVLNYLRFSAHRLEQSIVIIKDSGLVL